MSRAEFYGIPWVQQEIVRQGHHRYMTVRYEWGMARHYAKWEMGAISRNETQLWGKPPENGKNPFIEIHKAEGDTYDPTDFSYFLRKNVIEFIPEVSTVNDHGRTDCLIIDLDPKSKDFTWDDLITATKRTIDCLLTPSLEDDGVPLTQTQEEFSVRDWKLRFSGNRSFHIYIQLDKRVNFLVARDAVKRLLNEEEDDHYTYHNVRGRDDFVLVDIGAIARHRCVRSLYSVHAKTGLVCVPVPRDGLDQFGFESALPERVVAQGPTGERF